MTSSYPKFLYFHMTFKAKTPFSRDLATLAMVISAVAGGAAYGQSGVAPSQTGLFFDDLRNRAFSFRNGAVDESAPTASSGVYDYSRGEYSGEAVLEEERALGERAGTDDISRALGTPSVRSGYLGYSRRNVGDYSGAAGPYPSSSTYFAPAYITDPFLAGKRNIKLGPVNIGLGFGGNIEYNDNVTRASKDEISDMIAGAYLNVDANYPITESNRLSLALGIGIDHYFDHPELSANGNEFNLNVLPGSSLAFDIQVGDILFVLYDRVSVRPATNDQFTLDDNDIFGVFQNDVGLAMNWAINSKLSLSINFNHSDSLALEDEDERYDRTIDSISGSLAWSPSGTYTVGLEGSFSWINYKDTFQNDGTTATAGVFFVMPITRSTMLKAAGGVQVFEFDDPPSFTRSVSDADILSTQAQLAALDANAAATLPSISDPAQAKAQSAAYTEQRQQLSDLLAAQQIQKQADDDFENGHTFDGNDLSDYYYNVTLFNQLNSRIAHQLSFGHESSLNTTSNFITADYITYGMGIIAWRGSRISLATFYEQAEDSGGRLAENTDQWGIDAFLSHRLTNTVTLGFGYHYGNTDSNLEGRDYEQHAFTLDFNYAVNRKLNLGLGYRFWTTDAEDPTQSFDQNRVIMTVNYNF